MQEKFSIFSNDQQQEKQIFSVTQLNELVRDILENTFPSIWVEGEISNLSCPTSGHIYFTLKDAQSQIRCAMFRNRNLRLKDPVENGMQVILQAKVSLYAGRGDFQLIVEHIEKAGDGILQRQFEMLKQKLAKEGLFDEINKKTISRFPKQIGVITSATGAAIRDILSVIARRFPSIPVIIYPSQVQGDKAAEQLVKAIEIANQRQECDVILLARGGGSLEDLMAFNDEKLARAIFKSVIPLVSAVGHEIDFTIADFVADKRAPTPSAAAEMVCPDRNEYASLLIQKIHRATLAVKNLLHKKQNNLLTTEKKLKHPDARVREYLQRFDELSQRFMNAMDLSFRKKQQHVEMFAALLSSMSPLKTLARGYAIVSDENQKILTKISQIKLQQNIDVQLADGHLNCVVNEIKE